MKKMRVTWPLVIVLLLVISCKHDPILIDSPGKDNPVVQEPTPYNIEYPRGFPSIEMPKDNPLTVEGVALGRKLFYDVRLSGDNTMSCGSCHSVEYGYADSTKFSTGINGLKGKRSAMAIVNVGYNTASFWDGRAKTLEEQALMPVTDPLEMNAKWLDVLDKLNADEEYRAMFKLVFNADVIDSLDVAKAIAQFERTMISGDSKGDKFGRNETLLTIEESRGFQLFVSEKADCRHCHGSPLFMGFEFVNNGLQQTMTDIGYGAVTGLSTDNGKFRPPSLKNIALTGPYMHDGRFNTLEEVIEFYNSGVNQSSPNVSIDMLKANRGTDGNLHLTEQDKSDLLAFLKTLTDSTFLSNKNFQDPNK